MKFLSNQKNIFVVVLGVLFFVVLLSTGCRETKPKEINLNSELFANFKITETLSQDYATTYHLATNIDGGREFLSIEKIRGIKEASAKAIIQDSTFNIEAVYVNALSAYPGEVSNEIVCNEKFKPIYKEIVTPGSVHPYYLLYTTERFGLGACAEDTIAYKQLIGWIYCQKREELYTIKYAIPLNESFTKLEALFLSLKCK